MKLAERVCLEQRSLEGALKSFAEDLIVFHLPAKFFKRIKASAFQTGR